MWWYDEGLGWGAWVLMGTGMLVFWAAVVVVVVAAVRALRPGREDGRGAGGDGRDASARRMLDERLARGEVDAEDYRVRRELLDR